ncbi:hypothetical protein PR202_gb01929 [Eleusine coracana subsp. coracana]|uniref:starch synthase n=1 Tax=Eleusine coracana subsp. coracana TaxID=191504 RepID=A0AAV5DVM1_ELECO|nr:hypothetical protein PR202_gb01929 [Eleusine coracana subsp. coracana]
MENSDSQLLMELDALKEENMLIKDDIEFLKTQLVEITETEESLLKLEKERALLDTSLRDLECGFIAAQSDMLKLGPLQHDAWWEKVENLEELLESTAKQVEHAAMVLERYHDFPDMVEKIEASLRTANVSKFCLYLVDLLQQRVNSVEERFKVCNDEMQSQIELSGLHIVHIAAEMAPVAKVFLLIASNLSSHVFGCINGSTVAPFCDLPRSPAALLLRPCTCFPSSHHPTPASASSSSPSSHRASAPLSPLPLAIPLLHSRLLDLRPPPLPSQFGVADGERWGAMESGAVGHGGARWGVTGRGGEQHGGEQWGAVGSGAARLLGKTRVEKNESVGGLADVISGLAKSLQKKGHLVEIILPKYDCMQHGQIHNLKVLDVKVQSYFEGHLFGNKIWTGTVEGLPVYFIEPQHPAKFFWRAQYYGEHDDFKRFSYFSRAALELLYQSGKKIDIIHCHDWQTGFVAPLYWDIYANLGFNSARICFTCHNFEYQGTAPPQDLAYCGLDVERLDRPDRMQDNSHGRINVVKGAVVYSNIVTTVSPTYAQEVRSEIGCITRLVPQKGVHLIRHAIYKTAELGGQLFFWVQVQYLIFKCVFLIQICFSPLRSCLPKIMNILLFQREFEGIADHFKNNNNIQLILKYDDALSHMIFAASDMFIVPSMFEPCGLTQMIAMRYGSVPIVRKTGGLNDSVFDFDDETIPMELRNGFTFVNADEQSFNVALERAVNYYNRKPEMWKQLVQKDMRIGFSWDSSASQYEEIYQRAVARARAGA